jgi:hypothetical protein
MWYRFGGGYPFLSVLWFADNLDRIYVRICIRGLSRSRHILASER